MLKMQNILSPNTVPSLNIEEIRIFEDAAHKVIGSFVTSATKSHNFSIRDNSKMPISSYRSPDVPASWEFVLPKTNNTTLNETPECNENFSRQGTMKISHWKRLSLLLNSVKRLRNTEVVKIDHFNTLHSSVNDSPTSVTKHTDPHGMIITAGAMTRKALKDSREQAHFFKALERGSKKDVDYIKDRLTHDPRMYCYSDDDVERLPNKADYRGFTPLYTACRNGSVEIVKLLLQFKANPYQMSKIVGSEVNESILTVAARWNHVDVVKFLLEEGFTWDQNELKKAYKGTKNENIKELLEGKMKNKKRTSGGCFAFFKRKAN